MKFTLTSAAVMALSASQASAFPAIQQEYAARLLENYPRDLAKHQSQKRVQWDPKAQYVSTTGAHKFVPPNFAKGDLRGPCPGLNAAANHGYIPHNGVGTIGDFIKGTNEAYGMALDLGGFLGVYGAVFDGNLAAYSIGGPTSFNQLPLNNLLGLAGAPQGLSGSHNKYESDASPTRGDLYLFGNSDKVQVPQFQQYYDALVEGLPAGEQYNRLTDFHVARFNHSVQNNPNFFFSPFAGILVSPAGYSFPVRMMANHTAEHPDGSLTKEQLMMFFSITGKSGNFKYTVGHERIPDNWYKRAIGDEYTIPGFLADVLNHAEKYPPLLNVAANTGKVNSLAPIDFRSVTRGLFTTADLFKGNNLFCFLLQSSQAALPDIAGGATSNIGNLKAPLTNTIAQRLIGLGCPKLVDIDMKQFDAYPGYNKCPNGCSSY